MKDCPFKGLQSELAAATKRLLQTKLGNFTTSLAATNDVADNSSKEFFDADEDPAKDDTTAAEVLEVNFSDITKTLDWILDSKANTHLTGDSTSLTDLTPLPSSSRVSTAGGTALDVKGKCIINLSDTKFSDVLYVPFAHQNLLFVGKITYLGNSVHFTFSKCSIYDKHNCLRLIGSQDPTSRLYTLNVSPGHPPLSGHTVSLLPPPNAILWHNRIGHINFQSLYHMTKEHLVDGVPILLHIKGLCSACIEAKQTKEKIPCFSLSRSTRPFELIHSNVWGPAKVPSLTGAHYILTLTDDFSRFTWLFFLRHKADVLTKFQAFHAKALSQFQPPIGILCTNRGGEYLSDRFNMFFVLHGIHRQLTTAYTPTKMTYLNGRIKRFLMLLEFFA